MPELTRSSLSEQLAAVLRARILADFKPGELLPSENSLAEQYDVSRPVVREALSKLEGSGLLKVEMGRGAVVQNLDCQPLTQYFNWALQTDFENNFEQLMLLRRSVEIGAATLAAHRRTEDDAELLSSLITDMEGLESDSYARADPALHLAIARASKNPAFVNTIESLRQVLATAAVRGAGTEVVPPDNIRRHRVLVEAIINQEPEAAIAAMRDHFVMAFNRAGLPTDAIS